MHQLVTCQQQQVLLVSGIHGLLLHTVRTTLCFGFAVVPLAAAMVVNTVDKSVSVIYARGLCVNLMRHSDNSDMQPPLTLQ